MKLQDKFTISRKLPKFSPAKMDDATEQEVFNRMQMTQFEEKRFELVVIRAEDTVVVEPLRQVLGVL